MKVSLFAVLVLQGSLALAQSSQTGAAAATEPAAKPPTAPTKIDSAKEADIRKLMELTGADKLAEQMMSGMETNLRPNLINAFPPGEYRTQLVNLFFEKLSSKIGPATMELSIPVYDKYFSDEEIRQLTAFYQTPLGAKTTKVLPQLMAEIVTTSQVWAQQLMQDCMKEVLTEHPDLKQAMEDAGKAKKFQ
jgi:hypothetical protein